KTVLPAGEYKIELKVADQQLESLFSPISKTFSLSIFNNERITLSDIELAYNIERSTDKESDFYKNTLQIIPNPSSIFTDKLLWYYMESYNVSQLNDTGEIKIAVNLVDMDGKIINEKKYTKNKKNDSYVEIGNIDIKDLKSAYYTLIISVTDEEKNYSVYRKKLIYINHPYIQEIKIISNLNEKYEGSEYKYIPKEMIDTKLGQALYLANNNEKKLAAKLTTVDAKRKWLFEFWNKRTLQGKDYKDKFEDRVRYVNAKFTFRGKEGWQTERGRVYLVYGKPDIRERVPSSSDTNPYELWKYYQIQGGVVFYFIDENGFGDYKLVSSTHRNEYYDPNWRNYLY
ncbi:MAG: GWxTD domain-containing protein, partial [Calditrichia bacterium]|nr:GWxTD domain-containing protein [Calditrichia bacterium]